MAIITVRSQAELNMIPLDTNDVIRVEFGTPWVPAVVRNRYKYRVEARENSSVVARGNTQIVDYMEGATIQLSDNARTVYMPRNVEEYMNFYGIKHDKTHALFFKAVHLIDGVYCSDRDRSFHYNIGQKAIADGFDTNPLEDCGQGIHFSHMGWALDYGRGWSDLAIIEVKAKIKDVLLPKYSHGKVRAPQVEVIREVPLDECGVFGKILLKRRKEG